MKTVYDYINEANAFLGTPRGGSFSDGKRRLVAYKLNGVNSEMNDLECARLWRKIQNDTSWKKSYVDTKGKSYKPSIKKWIKEYDPSEYMLLTWDEQRMYHDDSLVIYYKD